MKALGALVLAAALAGCTPAVTSTTSTPSPRPAPSTPPATTTTPHEAQSGTGDPGPRLGTLPDHRLTPGAVQTRDLSIVCGQPTALRRNVTAETKAKVFAEYGVTTHSAATYEVDHLIPLELGGANDLANLWPEPAPGFHAKDSLENRLHSLVCTGHLQLEVAQDAIATDWTAAYVRYMP